MERKPQESAKPPPSPVEVRQPDPAAKQRPSDYDAPEYYAKDQKPKVATPGPSKEP